MAARRRRAQLRLWLLLIIIVVLRACNQLRNKEEQAVTSPDDLSRKTKQAHQLAEIDPAIWTLVPVAGHTLLAN